ncbi:MAG: tetratricopeptide repeat protein [Opitutales bacterium]
MTHSLPSFRWIAACLAFTGLGLALAQNPYFEEFADEPLTVLQSGQERIFLGYDDGLVSIRYSQGGAVAEQPVSPSLARNYRLTGQALEVMRNANDAMRGGSPGNALSALRATVYPMIKYHPLPEEFEQLHRGIRLLLEALIQAGELQEARSILNRMELDQLSLAYSGVAYQLASAYLQREQTEQAAEIARRIPMTGEFQPIVPSMVQLAENLREAQKYETAIELYQAIVENAGPELKPTAQLFLAYSMVLAERSSEAEDLIATLEEPGKDTRLFSLYKLLEGSLDYQAGNYGEALDTLTRGFVTAQTSFPWVPEMLFYIGECYARAGDAQAARNVWSEVITLYPSSPWSERAKTQREDLQGV